MFLHVSDVRCLEGYKLEVSFTDGSVREVDLTGELHGEVFEPLQDLDYFRKVAINPETRTIEWPHGADFAPEFLHRIGKEVDRAA